MDTVTVQIDDRARLMAALLAATSWPDDEQARKPHGTHAHARGTRRLVQAFDKHPAVLILQALIDRGVPLEEIFGYVMSLSWPGLQGEQPPSWAPPTWARHLLNFYDKSGLEQWWQEEAPVWEKSHHEAQKLFANANFREFMRPFVGDFDETMTFVPNVCYPTDSEIGLLVNHELWCIAPPRIAWGDNPPWPFDEDPAHIYRAALIQYGGLLMRRYLHQHEEVLAQATAKKLPVSRLFANTHDSWEDQFLMLFGSGMVAIFLEDNVSESEAQAYVLMEKKAHGLDVLPGVVSVLRRYLRGHEDGSYPTFIDYLPHFANHLRVAKTITSL